MIKNSVYVSLQEIVTPLPVSIFFNETFTPINFYQIVGLPKIGQKIFLHNRTLLMPFAVKSSSIAA